MNITKKQIKKNTLTTELDSNARFGRSFKHYFELKPEGKYYKITFRFSNGVIEVTSYSNRLNDRPKEEEILAYNKLGFIDEVYNYIQNI